ncbi:MAG: aminotransferase class III-fold pyridoxal phosphate-dependent enzyme, partial [Gammaproteobacteria bacterium]|nr:aminotransferase class III-fold pyridoxal phosphate-dependent enzyme [Gammaproteobacteria bacterium]
VFAGSYHGIFDEVVSRGTEAGGIRRTLPAAPGIPAASLENIIVLEYRSEESLRYIEAEADHIAAVMTEPVQGGNPSILPGDFLRKLREVTTSVGVPLIFDEVVTGFRVHPGGVQGLLGIQADIATYGKVCGGGMPIGVVAGRKQYMDALDGGYWQYGDDSRPEANMTFFAGTFVRHPLALAACVAVLTELKRQGPEFQKALNEKMARLADQLNGLFQETHLPMSLLSFSSFGRLDVTGDMPFVGLLYYLLRERGIHIWEGRAVILTSAHDGADIQKIVAAFREGIAALQAVGLLPTGESQDDEDAGERLSTPIPLKTALRTPPSAGARLGRTAEGHPAWFVEDPDATGSYLQLGDVLKDG